VTSEVADSVEAAEIAPAADPGFLQRYGGTIEYILIPGAALIAALGVFGIFVALFGKSPLDRISTCTRAPSAPGSPGRTR
jgi:general nucleoside transport system permease protein